MSNRARRQKEQEQNKETYDEEIRSQWIVEQNALKEKLITTDQLDFSLDDPSSLRYIGGVDISFVKDNTDACAAFVILEYPSLKVVAQIYKMVKLTLPYIPTFLAFREVPFLNDLCEEVKRDYPQYLPQVVFVDGNGFLHPRGFGLACHLGVLTGIPTIGIGKTLLWVDGVGIKEAKKLFQTCKTPGSWATLVGESGTEWGAAFRSTIDVSKPIFVSLGHRISLETACRLTALVCKFRIPEPVRVADLGSREYIRKNYHPE